MIENVGRRSLAVAAATALLGFAPLSGSMEQAHADGPVWGPSRMHAPVRHRLHHHHSQPRAPKARRPAKIARVTVSTSSPGVPVLPGKTYSWPYAVTNRSPVKASQVTFSAPLPASMQFVTAQQHCSWQARAVVCDLGDLNSGQTKAGVITAQIAPKAAPGQPISSPAVVHWNTSQTTTNFPAVQVASTADVAVLKAGPAAVRPGQPLQYSITVTNNGPAVARNVVVHDLTTIHGGQVVPEAETDAQCLNAQGAGSGSASASGMGLSCGLGDLMVGQTRSLQVKVSPAKDFRPGTVIEAPVEATSPTIDTNLQNNKSSVQTRVKPGARPARPEGRKVRPVAATQLGGLVCRHDAPGQDDQAMAGDHAAGGGSYAPDRSGGCSPGCGDFGAGGGHAPGAGTAAPGREHCAPGLGLGRGTQLPNTGAPVTSMVHTAAALLGTGLILFRLGRPRRRRRTALM